MAPLPNPALRNSFDDRAAKKRCLGYRRRILELSQSVSALHVAPAFSCLEIVDAVYNAFVRQDQKGALLDTFVMSKGHGVMAQYVVLEDLGILSTGELNRYCRPDGKLGAHPDYGVPGIEASTGSLGHGLSIAAGMAYADKVAGTDRATFVVLGDGEIQEGSVWEAVMMAANLKVSNLIAFVDFNNYQGLGKTNETHPYLYPVAEKMAAFGWEAVDLDGHNAESIVDAIRSRRGDKPMMIVCRTVKGRGVSYMIDAPIWHYRSPNKEEYAQALAELAAEEAAL